MPLYISGGTSTDDDAIHDDVSAEISAITEKASPVDADLLLIEDSEASNVKKKLQIGNLPTGSGNDNIGAKVTKSSNQSVNVDTMTLITWNTESWDTDNIHDTVTNNERLTVPVAGVYLLEGQIHSQNVATWEYLVIAKNGTTIGGVVYDTYAGIEHRAQIHLLDTAEVDDYYTLSWWQHSGTISVYATESFFSIQLIAAIEA